MHFNVTFLGDKELQRALGELTDKLERRVLSQSLRVVAQTVLASARAAVPIGTGRLGIRAATRRRAAKVVRRHIRESLKITALRRRKGRVGWSVGPKKPADAGRWFPAAHLELGHRVRHGRGRVAAHRYLRPAIVGVSNARLLDQLAGEIRSRIDREKLT